jgi:phosphosulfolactate synthase
MLLDKGLGANAIDDLADVAGIYCDYAKIAWGSSLITCNLEKKFTLYRERGINVLLGGTMFEYAYLRNSADRLLDVARDLNIHIEISDGVVQIPRKDKLQWIERFAKHVEVFSEVGRKTGKEKNDWKSMLEEDFRAGARKVVIEGREIGPPGQEIRGDLVEELLQVTHADNMIFEALERPQQVWLIRHLGPNVNLGNILPPDLLTLESFRQGLKEHTLLHTWEVER